MADLRLLKQNFGKKELIDVINEKDLGLFIENHKKVIKNRYPDYSYVSFDFDEIEVDDHMIIFNIHYSFKNSSYFSRRMIKESHTVLIKAV